MTSQQIKRILTILSVSFVAAVAWAADNDVVQSVGHGQVHWGDNTVTATGSGAPSLKAANVAVARLGAERAAKMDAFRNILEAVKGVRLSSGQSVSAMMDTSPQLKSRVEGVLRSFKVVDTRYYSDGGVDVVVQAPLTGVILDALLPKAGSSEDKTTGVMSEHTGLVVNARGLALTPAISPRLVDEDGNVVYSAAFVNRDAALQRGIATYHKSVDAATKSKRVASKPVLVKAMKLAAPGSSDLVIGAADLAKVASAKNALQQGRIVIVVD
jgi:hypothetical protein